MPTNTDPTNTDGLAQLDPAGVAAAMEWRALLGEPLRAITSATDAAAAAADAAAAAADAATTTAAETFGRRELRPLGATTQGGGALGSIFTLPHGEGAIIVERVASTFAYGAGAVLGTELVVQVFAAPGTGTKVDGTGNPPAEWIGLDLGTVAPVASPAVGPPPTIIFDPPAGYTVPAGYSLVVWCLANATALRCTAQFRRAVNP